MAFYKFSVTEKQYNVAEAVDNVFASLFFPPGEDSKDSN